MKTAVFLSENLQFCKDAKIIIHSMNYYGSKNMFHVLHNRSVAMCPFTNLKDLIINL